MRDLMRKTLRWKKVTEKEMHYMFGNTMGFPLVCPVLPCFSLEFAYERTYMGLYIFDLEICLH